MKQHLKQNPWLYTLIFLCGLIHLVFLAYGSYQRSYDAYIHIFFGSHWVQHWWNDIDTRWFTGFSVFSYPPFAHQLLALPGFLISMEWSYILLQTLTLMGFAVGIYRYTRLWFNDLTGRIAIVFLTFSSALALTVHLFGQYPNTVSLALMLNVIPFMRRWVVEGKKMDLLISLALFAPASFTSLFSNLFGFIFFALPVILDCILALSLPQHQDAFVPSAPVKGGWLRLGLLAILAAALAYLCLSPFFFYLQAYPFEQVPIPHASRGNVLLWNETNYFMFYGLYGLMLVFLPLCLIFILFQTRYLVFAPSMVALFLLSLGGAHPYNRYLPGNLFEVITFDRFCFWLSILLIPLCAHLVLKSWYALRGFVLFKFLDLLVATVIGCAYIGFFAVNASSPFWKNLPPVLTEPDKIVNVLNQEKIARYRYITLGIGAPNFAHLSSLTSTPSLDGYYYFARRIPEMNQVPMGMLEEAKFYDVPSINALAKILLHPQKYSLKYVLVKDRYYELLLKTAGWYPVQTLPDSIRLWTTQEAIDPAKSELVPSPLAYRLIWGLGPLLSFILALWAMWRSRKVRASHAP